MTQYGPHDWRPAWWAGGTSASTPPVHGQATPPRKPSLALLAKPWAIEERSLRAVAQAILQGQGFGSPLGAAPPPDERRVGIVRIYGPLVMDWEDAYWLGGTAYPWIQRRLELLQDSGVDAVVLDVASPGGEVEGAETTARMVRALREDVPVVAVASGSMASAAYWIGSQATRVLAGRSSLVGDIGVYATFRDYSGMDADLGIETLEFVSAQTPQKHLDPATPEGAADVQRIVDQVAQVFIEDVAAGRGVSEAVVERDFGQGSSLVGEAAVSAGLADGIGFVQDVTEQLLDPEAASGLLALRSEGDDGMEWKDLNLDLLKAHRPELLEQARAGMVPEGQLDEVRQQLGTEQAQAVEAARAEGRTEGLEAGREEGATAERERVAAIRSAAFEGQDDVVADLVANGTAAADAVWWLNAHQKTRASLRDDDVEGRPPKQPKDREGETRAERIGRQYSPHRRAEDARA